MKPATTLMTIFQAERLLRLAAQIIAAANFANFLFMCRFGVNPRRDFSRLVTPVALTDGCVQGSIHMSINGVAAGLRNFG